jgi:hypothetical protein
MVPKGPPFDPQIAGIETAIMISPVDLRRE